MVNAQEWLDQNYPTKKEIELDLRNQNLEGALTISDWKLLKTIKCGNNRLTNLKIENCPNLTNLNIANNLLTDTNFLSRLDPKKLTIISIHSNNFFQQDLSFLTDFANLEQLFLDNHDQLKFNENIYNRFTGSLQPLQNLNQLKYLNIANTDIDSGLEHSPTSLRKICLINSWERKSAGYLKIKEELERTARFPRVTEKIQQNEENEPIFAKSWYRLAPLRQMKELQGEKIFKRWISCQRAQTWLNENCPTNRQYYKELVMSNKNVIETLDLKDFASLEKLDCSDNQLTNLNLTNCLNLIELNCSGNSFTNTKFLQQLPNPKRLEILKLNNHEFKEDLNFLAPFTNLKELDISNCPFFGSLKPLEKMGKLKTIIISNTDVSSGLDYLSDSCQELHCSPDTEKKSSKIALLLTKYREKGRNKEKYYNLAKWREEWRNNIVLSIPTERLYVIRGNIKQFMNKWGGKGNNSFSELSKLKSPESPDELQNHRWAIYGTQLIGRGAAVAGIVLTFQGYSNEGTAILAIYPFTELAVSKLEESLRNKKERWKEFLTDADALLDNYHELLGILEQLGEYKLLGKINQTLNDLKIKTKLFLEKYDDDGNGTIDVSELTSQEARKKLAKDLSNKDKPSLGTESQKSEIKAETCSAVDIDNNEKLEATDELEKEEGNQLRSIMLAIRELEKKISEHRQGSYREYYGIEEVNKIIGQNPIGESQESEVEQGDHSIDIDECAKEKLENQIQITPK